MPDPTLLERGRRLAVALKDTLPAEPPAGLFNPWTQTCADDTAHNNPQARLERLGAHFACNARWLCVGEAAGWLGARRSAVAFTSERLLLEGAIPRVTPPAGRLSTRRLPYSEPSATIVWGALKNLGMAEHTVLWNALGLHPFRPGEPDSNRTPTDAELLLGEPALRLVLEAYPQAQVVAVGRKAEALLARLGVRAIAVRHPANGGAKAFWQGMAQVAGSSV